MDEQELKNIKNLLTLDNIKVLLSNLPESFYIPLIVDVVENALKNKVFVAGGVVKLVSALEHQYFLREQKLKFRMRRRKRKESHVNSDSERITENLSQ